jgi:hypothetical protein
MNQELICLFLVIKGHSAQAIHNEFVARLRPDAIAYWTAAKYLHQWQFASVPCQNPGGPPGTFIHSVILDALEKQPCSSIRDLPKLT